MYSSAVSALDFHFHAAGEFELHESVDDFGGGVVDVDQALVAAELELLAAFLVYESGAVDREDAFVSGQGYGTADNRTDALYGLYDLLGAFVDETVVVGLQFDSDDGVHMVY